MKSHMWINLIAIKLGGSVITWMYYRGVCLQKNEIFHHGSFLYGVLCVCSL